MHNSVPAWGRGGVNKFSPTRLSLFKELLQTILPLPFPLFSNKPHLHIILFFPTSLRTFPSSVFPHFFSVFLPPFFCFPASFFCFSASFFLASCLLFLFSCLLFWFPASFFLFSCLLFCFPASFFPGQWSVIPSHKKRKVIPQSINQ